MKRMLLVALFAAVLVGWPMGAHALTITPFPVPTANSAPSGITVGPDGALWFTENIADQIGRATRDGVVTNEFPAGAGGASGGFQSITAGPDGNVWFVRDAAANQVAVMTPAGAVTNVTLTTPASGPVSILAGPDGNMWVAENQSKKLARINISTHAVDEFTTGAAAPSGLISAPDGTIRFTGSNASFHGQMSTAGTLLTVQTGFGTVGTSLSGITVGPDGNVWFADKGAGRIDRLNPGGTVTETPVTFVPSGPLALVNGGDGGIWFTNENTPFLGRLGPGTTIVGHPLPTGSTAVGIARACDGNLWATTPGANALVRIRPDAPATATCGGSDPLPPVTCAGLTSTTPGTPGSDVITGTPGNDVIAAGAGDDIVRGLGGDDVICGGDGNDKIKGGTGRDRLYGDAGRDKLRGGGAKDFCFGGADKDAIGCEKAKHN